MVCPQHLLAASAARASQAECTSLRSSESHVVAQHSMVWVMRRHRADQDQLALAPENFTTLAHFSVSSAMSFLKSVGEPGSTVSPRSASRALILESARAALISLLSLSMISAGVFLGAPTPNQALAS